MPRDAPLPGEASLFMWSVLAGYLQIPITTCIFSVTPENEVDPGIIGRNSLLLFLLIPNFRPVIYEFMGPIRSEWPLGLELEAVLRPAAWQPVACFRRRDFGAF